MCVTNRSTIEPRSGGTPKPWLLCWLRDSAASSPIASPRRGSYALTSTSSASFGGGGEPGQFERFWSRRVACHGATPCASCAGNRFGSAAAANASRARIADAVWWPWFGGDSENRVTITSGWNERIAHTTSASASSRPHRASVSSAVFE
jgi:hypothetical protein